MADGCRLGVRLSGRDDCEQPGQSLPALCLDFTAVLPEDDFHKCSEAGKWGVHSPRYWLRAPL